MVTVILAVCGVIIALGGATMAMPVLWRALRTAAKAPAMVEQMVKEFSPNSGSTMRDSMDRMEFRLNELADSQVELNTRMLDMSDTLVDHAAHDENFARVVQERFHSLINAVMTNTGHIARLIADKEDRDNPTEAQA